jgi:hypothetical protein
VPDFYADEVCRRLNKELAEQAFKWGDSWMHQPRGHDGRWTGGDTGILADVTGEKPGHGFAPGSAEHANAVRELANHVGDRSPDAEHALQRASDAIDRGDFTQARGHIADAHYNLLADHGSPEDVAAIDESARGLSHLHSTRTSSSPGTPLSPAYHFGTNHPLAHPEQSSSAPLASANPNAYDRFHEMANSPTEADMSTRGGVTPSGTSYVFDAAGRPVDMYGRTVPGVAAEPALAPGTHIPAAMNNESMAMARRAGLLAAAGKSADERNDPVVERLRAALRAT